MMTDTRHALDEAKRILNRAKQGALPAIMVPVWVLEILITEAERRPTT